AVEKEERDQQRAQQRKEIDQRKAQRQRDKEAHNTQKDIQQSQLGKRKASNPLARPKKKRHHGVAACRGIVLASPPREVPTTTTRHGQTSTLPARF
ncbi:hypothetical protein BU25DRAFT_309904, partial [Macroventuria anomochaeta]